MLKFMLISSLLTLTTLSFADTTKSPENFKAGNTNAVFIDVISIATRITYDLKTEKALAETEMTFTMSEEGSPIFDLVPAIISAKLDNKDIAIKQISSPTSITTYKVINKVLKPGQYTLNITNRFVKNIKFKQGSLFSKEYIRSAFWMSDLNDRRYIEQYIPTNIEYDQYKLDLEIVLKNTKVDHIVRTNGALTNTAKNHFNISFPKYFTASSFYFHLMDKGHYPSVSFDYKSITGQSFPVVIYTANKSELASLKKLTINVLDELEAKLGAWSHPSLIIYKAGMGGMEHSGATITSKRALGHELTHSYYARGVMPIDGNSGWMDEAIASWRDKGYQAVKIPSFQSTQMSAHSQYKRSTDRKAYSEGANFMAFLNNELKEQGGLITFLAQFYKKYTHKNVDTNLFKKELDLFSGRDFSAEFNQYIFGMNHVEETNTKGLNKVNPNHPRLTEKQLLDLL